MSFLICKLKLVLQIRYINHKINLQMPALSPSKSSKSLTPVSPSYQIGGGAYQMYPSFTFQSKSQSNNDECSPHLVDEDNTDYSQYRQLLESEFKMRMDSIVKGYEIKIAKQSETFELRQIKCQEEIEYLKRQVKELCAINQNRRSQFGENTHCSLCSNGQILTFMRNMQEALQADHSNCLVEKKSLNSHLLSVSQKLSVVESELQQIDQKYEKIKAECKQLKAQKEAWQREKREKERQFREVERNYQVKELDFEQQYAKHQIMQKQLEAEIKRTQIRHIEEVNKIKDDQFYLQQKRQQQQHLDLMINNKEAKENRREMVRQFQKDQVKRVHKYEYETDHYYPLPGSRDSHSPMKQIPMSPNQSYQPTLIAQKPSLSRLPMKTSTHMMPRSNKLSSFFKNDNQTQQQSYAEYANHRRQTRKAQINRSGIGMQREDSFDTFRPFAGGGSKTYANGF